MSEFRYQFRILDYRVIDGDSVEATLDLGLGIRSREFIRLMGVDAPEVRTKDLIEKQAGISAKDWLIDHMDSAFCLVCDSVEFRRGKYGRVLGNIMADGVNLNSQMIAENFAKRYVT